MNWELYKTLNSLTEFMLYKNFHNTTSPNIAVLDNMKLSWDQSCNDFTFIHVECEEYDDYDDDEYRLNVRLFADDGEYEIMYNNESYLIPNNKDMYFHKSISHPDIMKIPFNFVELLNSVHHHISTGLYITKQEITIYFSVGGSITITDVASSKLTDGEFIVITNDGKNHLFPKQHILHIETTEV